MGPLAKAPGNQILNSSITLSCCRYVLRCYPLHLRESRGQDLHCHIDYPHCQISVMSSSLCVLPEKLANVRSSMASCCTYRNSDVRTHVTTSPSSLHSSHFQRLAPVLSTVCVPSALLWEAPAARSGLQAKTSAGVTVCRKAGARTR